MTFVSRLSVMLCGLLAPILLFAQPALAECKPGSGALPIPTWYQYLPGENNPAGGCDIKTDGLGGRLVVLVFMGIFDILLFLAGFIAVIVVMYGGFRMLTSSGEPQKIAAARTTIINALVGLAIAVISSQIVGFIAGRLS